MATIVQNQYSRELDALREMEEQFRETPEAERTAAMVERIEKQRARMTRCFWACHYEFEASLGPVALQLRPNGIIYATQSSPLGGGRSVPIPPGSPHFAQALALVRSQQSQDAAVAEIAFVIWGWRGAVRIDYYGDLAIVRRGGGSVVVVDLPSMIGQVR